MVGVTGYLHGSQIAAQVYLKMEIMKVNRFLEQAIKIWKEQRNCDLYAELG